MATLHMHLDFRVLKGPLWCSNSTICPRTGLKRPLKGPQFVHIRRRQPQTKTRVEYWDRGRGGRNIVWETSTTNEVRTRKWMRADQKGVKMSSIHPFGHHKWTRIIFGKPWFSLVFEPFVVPNGPIFKALSALGGAEVAHHGLKMGSFHFFVHPI